MSHADYSALTLEQAKAQALLEIEVWYGGAGQDVFDSNAKGAVYRYYCWPEHVSRIVALSSSNAGKGTPGQLMCGIVPTNPDGSLVTDQDPSWGLVQHTAREVKTVHEQYAVFIGRVDAKRDEFVLTVNTATEIAQIESVVNGLENYRVL